MKHHVAGLLLLNAIWTMSASALADDWSDVQSQLASQKPVWTSPPTNVAVATMTHAPIIGNGRLGVGHGGNQNSFALHVFHHELRVNSTGSGPKSREIPLGQVLISSLPTGGSGSATYRIESDYEKAELRSTLPLNGFPIAIKTWLAEGEGLIVTEITSLGSASFDIKVTDLAPDSDQVNRPATAGVSSSTPWVARANVVGSTITFPIRVVMASRALGKTTTSTSDLVNESSLTFTIAPSETVKVLTQVGGGRNPVDEVNTTVAALNAHTDTQVSTKYSDHVQWFKDHYLKSFVLTDDAPINGFYFAELYALGINARTGVSTAPYLYGNFRFSEDTNWPGYTTDYNHEAPMWGVYSSNRVDMADSHYRVLIDQMPRGRQVALSQGFSKGLLYYVQIGPWGVDSSTQLWGMHSNAVFGAQNFLAHYAYTKDLAFWDRTDLSDDGVTTPYDYLLEVADFWEDKFAGGKDTTGEFTGKYVVRNSAARENLYPTDINPIADLGMVGRLMRGLVEISIALGRDASRRATWQDIADSLSPLPTMQCPNVVGACYKEAHNRSTMSLLFPRDNFLVVGNPVFPAELTSLTDSSADGELMRHRMRNSLLEEGSWAQSNSFAGVFTTAVRSGYDNRDLLNRFKSVSATYKLPNGLYANPSHGYEAAGALEAINSMVLQSQHDFVWLFPMWPNDRAARFKDLRAHGAFVISSSVDSSGVVGTTFVHSEKGATLKIRKPWATTSVVNSVGASIPATVAGDLISFATVAGETYTLTGTGSPPFSPYQARSPNLALSKTVTGKSSQYDAGQWAATNINDGMVTATERGWASIYGNNPRNEWVTLDLGAAQAINSFTIKNEDWANNRNVKDYVLYGSATGAFAGEEFIVVSGTIPPLLAQQEHSVSFAPVSARYLKFKGTSSYSNYVIVGELSLFSPDLALNRTVTGFSSQYDTTQMRASNINDGSVNASNRAWSSVIGSGVRNEWVTLDLGSTRAIASFVLKNEDAADNRNVKDYVLYGSSTGAFTGEEFVISSGTIPSLLRMQTHPVTFPTVNARYVKFKGTSSYSSYVIVGNLSLYGP